MSGELHPEYEFDSRQAKPNRFAVGLTVELKPLAEVTRQAIEILSRELVPANAMRFIGQYTTGRGDYTAERETLFGQATLEQVSTNIKAAAKPGT
jgi:hypothetical protein